MPNRHTPVMLRAASDTEISRAGTLFTPQGTCRRSRRLRRLAASRTAQGDAMTTAREFTAATLRLGEAGEETEVKVGVFAPETEPNLAICIHAVARPKRPGFPVNLRLSKQAALRLAVKLIEAAAEDASLGTSQHRPGSAPLA